MTESRRRPDCSWYGRISGWRGDPKPWLIIPSEPQRSDRHRTVSYDELHQRVMQLGGALQTLCGRHDGRVVVIADNTPETCSIVLGTFASTLTVVPVAPCRLGQNRQTWIEALTRMCEDTRPVLLVGRDELLPERTPLAGMRMVGFNALSTLRPTIALCDLTGEQDLALIQYTSGTTHRPRGVELTHGNILRNIGMIGDAIGVEEGDIGVSWLPLFHDMGLIGCLLFSAWFHIPMVLLSPRMFLTRPEAWLWSIARFGATLCAAPNSAYQVCASKVPEHKFEGLDLSRWRVAMNGSELVHAETVEAFCGRFQPYGFRRSAMLPVYGLAENTLATTIPCPREQGPEVDWVERAQLESGGVAVPHAERSARTRGVVALGPALPGQQLRVMNDEGVPVHDRVVGAVEVRGPCVTRGRHTDGAQGAFSVDTDGWLRTGDRGYLVGGRLYVVGRDKHVIKRAGRSYDAAEIQSVVQTIENVRGGQVAVFGVPLVATGTEELVVMIETNRHDAHALAMLRSAVRERMQQAFAIRPDAIALVGIGTIPRTTSGKTQHTLARERYLALAASATPETVLGPQSQEGDHRTDESRA